MKRLFPNLHWRVNHEHSREISPFLPEGFHGDKYLIHVVNEIVKQVDVFIETGTNVGSTLAYMARSYPKLDCFSCEPDNSAFVEAQKNVGGRENVHLFNETSQEFMQRLSTHFPEIFQKPTGFWVDAHGYGFQWPLREEIAFITHRFSTAFILIDDFKVPGHPQFGYDRYLDQECSYEYIQSAINPQNSYHVIYPAYKDRTSSFHPLRGWVLIYFGADPIEIRQDLKVMTSIINQL